MSPGGRPPATQASRRRPAAGETGGGVRGPRRGPGGGWSRAEIYIREDGAEPGRGSPPSLTRDISGPRRARTGRRTPVGRPWGLGGAGGRPDGRARARGGGWAPGGPFWTHPDLWTPPNWPVGGTQFRTHPKLTSWRWARARQPSCARLRPPAPACARRPSRAPPRGQTGDAGAMARRACWRGGQWVGGQVT